MSEINNMSNMSNVPTSKEIITFFGFVLFANLCIRAYEESAKSKSLTAD